MSPTSPLSHKTWEVEEGFEEWSQKKKKREKGRRKKRKKEWGRILEGEGSQKNVEGGSQQERGKRKKRKERREKKKGFCILIRLSSSALTKVLSWSD